MSEEVENEEGGALLTLDSIEWPIYPDYVYKFETNSTNTGRGLIFKLTNELVKKRLRSYSRSGMRTTVCGLIMCHSQGVPHVLLLKREEDGCYGLLGGKCKIYENPREKLSHKLARFITCNTRHANLYDIKSSIENIKVKEFLADWWRCDYHTDPLPFLPLHTSRPKEKISIYQVILNENFTISVPEGIRLVSVPLYDFYDTQFGLTICALPHLLSRFNICFMSTD